MVKWTESKINEYARDSAKKICDTAYKDRHELGPIELSFLQEICNTLDR